MPGRRRVPKTRIAIIVGVGAGLLWFIPESLLTMLLLDVSTLEGLALRRTRFDIPVGLLQLALLLATGVSAALVSGLVLRCWRRCSVEQWLRWLVFLTFASSASILLGLRLAVALRAAESPEALARVVTQIGLGLIAASLLSWLVARRVPIAPSLPSMRALIPLGVAGLATLCFACVPMHLERGAPRVPSLAAPPNILFVVLDTVRADSLTSYGAPAQATPNLARLAGESLSFTRAYAAAPWTLPSHASMFTGLSPSAHGAGWEHMVLDAPFETVAEALSGRGYRSIAISENPFVSSPFGLLQGFDEFVPMYRDTEPPAFFLANRLQARMAREHWRGEFARDTVNRFKAWTAAEREDERPFFAFINFMAAHLPRYARAKEGAEKPAVPSSERVELVNLLPELHYVERYRLDSRELAAMRAVYADEVHYLDREIGRLLDYLRDSGLSENTVVIVTSDHGENFGEHGLIEHQFCVYNSLLHVPLMLRLPERLASATTARGVVESPVSTAALAPTILELAGCDDCALSRGAETRSLLAIGEPSPVVSESDNAVEVLRSVIPAHDPDFDYAPFDRRLQAVQDSEYKLIRDSRGGLELYRLQEDPRELRNLAQREPEKTADLLAVLEARVGGLEEHARKPSASEKRPIDPETQLQLRGLGYAF